MTGGKRRYAKDVNVVFNSLAGCLGRGLEERAHIYVEAAVGITGCYYFSTTVVTVLTHLGNHDTGLAAFAFCEVLTHLLSFDEVRVFFVSFEYTPEIVLITAL